MKDKKYVNHQMKVLDTKKMQTSGKSNFVFSLERYKVRFTFV